MKSAAVICLSFLVLFSPPLLASNPVADYAFAQKCYHTLDKTISRGWDKCIRQFEEITAAYPRSEQAAKALFSIGRLYQEKYGITREEDDLQKAFRSLNEFIRMYPRDAMADDALYRIAVLRFEKQGDREKAIKALKALLERYPDGDMAPAALEYLEKIGGERPGNVISAPRDKEDGPNPKPLPFVLKEPSEPEAGFRIKTVAIDPGHGGEDTGAQGPGGLKEADVALQIARKVAFKLKNELKLKPFLTRTRNKTLGLEERNQIAGKKGADLFISIHANASESPKASGVQVFYLNNATSQAAKRLAERENRLSRKPKAVSEKILSTMLQNANTEESRDLAKYVQKSLVQNLGKKYPGVKDLKVDAALFYVLVGSKSPGILVETSFISNPKEEKRLKDSQYQWDIAQGITDGVKKFIETRNRVATSL